MASKKQESPADYCIISSDPQYRLSPFERSTLVGGTELERAVAWILRQLTTFSLQPALERIDVAALQAAADFYDRPDWRKAPEKFFVRPQGLDPVTVTPVHGLADGQICDIEFPSAYKVQNPGFRETYAQEKRNHTVYARIWRHERRARGTVIAVHGWTMGDQRVNSLAFLPGVLYAYGLDVVLVELPYHGRRKELGKTDDPFPGADMVRTNEALAQALSDLRQLKQHLRSVGARNVGCIGMSLGAYVCSLWAALDRLAFCIPVVPLASLSDVAWRSLRQRPEFPALHAAGLRRRLLERICYMHAPISHRPKTAAERVLILAGLGDQIVPREHPKLLRLHWGGATLRWFRGGHMAQFKGPRALREIITFLARRGLVQSSDKAASVAKLP